MINVPSFVSKTLLRPKAFIALELPADKQTAPRILRAVLPYSTDAALGSHACVALSSVPVMKQYNNVQAKATVSS
jgi:hypothetical protein